MSTTTRQFLASTVDAAGKVCDLRMDLRWDSNDPFAVFMDVHTSAGVARWVFAIDLLIDGLRNEAGIGDVRVRPAGHGWLEIVLQPGPRQAVLKVAAFHAAGFIADTWVAEPSIPDYVDDLFTDEGAAS